MILGMDLGVRKVAVFGADSTRAMTRTFTVDQTNRDAELKKLHNHLITMICSLATEYTIFVEEPPYVRNNRTFLQLAQTSGMVLTLPVPVYVVPVSSWKQRTVGRGNASKTDVSSWLHREHPDHHRLCNGDQDLYDSAAIYHYGVSVSQALVSGCGSDC